LIKIHSSSEMEERELESSFLSLKSLLLMIIYCFVFLSWIEAEVFELGWAFCVAELWGSFFSTKDYIL